MVARPVRYGRRNNVKLIYSWACSRVGYIPYIPTGEVVLRPAHWTAWATPCHPEMGFAVVNCMRHVDYGTRDVPRTRQTGTML